MNMTMTMIVAKVLVVLFSFTGAANMYKCIENADTSAGYMLFLNQLTLASWPLALAAIILMMTLILEFVETLVLTAKDTKQTMPPSTKVYEGKTQHATVAIKKQSRAIIQQSKQSYFGQIASPPAELTHTHTLDSYQPPRVLEQELASKQQPTAAVDGADLYHNRSLEQAKAAYQEAAQEQGSYPQPSSCRAYSTQDNLSKIVEAPRQSISPIQTECNEYNTNIKQKNDTLLDAQAKQSASGQPQPAAELQSAQKALNLNYFQIGS